MTFTVRAYNPDHFSDLNAMIALIQDAWAHGLRTGTHYHIGDLYWRLREPSYEDALWLWEDGHGRLAGFAEIQYYQEDAILGLQIHPCCLGSGLSADILDWALDLAATHSLQKEAQTSGSVTVFAADTDIRFQSLLESRAFRRQDNSNHLYGRPLRAEQREVPSMPEGYVIRPLTGIGEIHQRVLGHQAGWQSLRMTASKYERLMQMPGYRPDLDLVVVAPDGSFAATCNLWLDERNRAGLFEPVSTSAAHRRLGLGRALVSYGLEQLGSLGAERACVGTDCGNLAATSLYGRCGLALLRQDFAWTHVQK